MVKTGMRFTNMFKKTTIDSIIADITKKIDDLKNMENEHLAKADEHESQIVQAIAAKKAQMTEAARAVKIRNKFEGLVG